MPAKSDYGPRHVNVLRNMLERRVSAPHRLTCVTDDPAGIDPRIDIVPLWDKCRALGGCFNRLWVFSREAGAIFGERFVCIDLDAVLVADCSTLFERSEAFVINAYNPAKNCTNDQRYNGGMFMLTAGARASVWDEFDPETVPARITANPKVIGTDQAWLRIHLGRDEARWTNADGVYEARQIGPRVPPNARLVLFSGPRDPSTSKFNWVRQQWR